MRKHGRKGTSNETVIEGQKDPGKNHRPSHKREVNPRAGVNLLEIESVIQN